MGPHVNEVLMFCCAQPVSARRERIRSESVVCAKLSTQKRSERRARVAAPRLAARSQRAMPAPERVARPTAASSIPITGRDGAAALDSAVCPPVRRISWGTISNKPHRNVVSYNLQLKALCKAGNLDEMLVVMKDMDESGIQPDLMSYASVLHCCRKVGATDKAAEIMRTMRRSGIEPDQRIYTRMLSVYRNAKPPRVREAFSLLQEMRQSGHPLTTSSCNMVLESCANRREVMLALQVYGLMKEYNVKANEKTYHAMARLYNNVRMYDEAIEMYSLMVRSGIQLGPVSYTQMMHALSQTRRYDECFVTFQEMCAAGISPLLSTYNILITAAGCSGDFEKAEGFFAELYDQGLRSDRHTYNAFLFACLKSQKLERAIDAYENMGIDKVSPSCATYRTLIRLAAEVGDQAVLQRLVTDVRNDLSCVPSHATMVEIVSAVTLLMGIESGAQTLKDFSSRFELSKSFFETLSETLKSKKVSVSSFVRALEREC